MNENNDSEEQIKRFPDYVAENYSYSEYIEYFQDDKIAAAEDVRYDIRKLLEVLQKHFPKDKIALALNSFLENHPIDQDLDEDMGALSYGMERELSDLLCTELCEGVDKELVLIIDRILEEKFIPDYAGDKTNFRVNAIGAIKILQEELDLDASASKLLIKNTLETYPDDPRIIRDVVFRLQNYFKGTKFQGGKTAKSNFIREKLDPDNFSTDFWYDLMNFPPYEVGEGEDPRY